MKVVETRRPKDISRKVAVPSAVLAAVGVVWGLLNGVDYEPQQVVLVLAGLVNFVIGYRTTDKRIVG